MNRDKFITLANLFENFPGVGPRQALRLTNFIVRSDKQFILDLAEAMKELKESTRVCPTCYSSHNGQTSICSICSDENRDRTKLIIVEKDTDIIVFEASGVKEGSYFNLGSLIPIATESHTARIKELTKLITKLSNSKQPLKEVILAFSLHPDAEHTAEFLKSVLKQQFPTLKIKLLGKGLSTGTEIEYADPETLKNAFKMRT